MRGFLFLCGLGAIIGFAYSSKPKQESKAVATYYPPNIYFVALDEDSFSFQMRADAFLAMRDWEDKAPGLVFQVVDKPCYHDHCIILIGRTLEMLAQEHGIPPGNDRYIGWCDINARPIQVEVGDSCFDSEYAFRHELGHSLGLHHGHEDTVMYCHNNRGAKSVTCGDVAAYYKSIHEPIPVCR